MAACVMTGCGKKPEVSEEITEETTQTEETTAEPTATPTPRPTRVPTPRPTSAPTAAPTPTPVPFDPIAFADGIDLFPQYSDDDLYGDNEILDVCINLENYDYNWSVTGKWGYSNVVILEDTTAEAYPELSASLNDLNEELRQRGTDYLDLADSVSFVQNAAIRRADSRMFSILVTDTHSRETAGVYGYNFDPATGNELVLEDVFSDTDSLCDILGISSADELTGDRCAFLVEPSGVTFVFLNDSGEKEYKTILYHGNESIFAVDDIFDLSTYVIDLSDVSEDGWEYTIDIDNDGEADVIEGYGISEGDASYSVYIGIGITVNGNELVKDDEIWGYTATPMIVCEDGSYYLIFVMAEDNAWCNTVVFSFDEDHAEFYCKLEGGITGAPVALDNNNMEASNPCVTVIDQCSFTDPSHMFVRNVVNLFSSYQGYYPISFSSMPDYESGYGISDCHYVLTALCDVEATDPDSGASVVIPEATELRIALANGNAGSVVLQDIATGDTYEITVDDVDEWNRTVNGVDEYELFDGIGYGG